MFNLILFDIFIIYLEGISYYLLTLCYLIYLFLTEKTVNYKYLNNKMINFSFTLLLFSDDKYAPFF